MVIRITTWNVNGLRSMKKDIAAVLCDLNADVVCFQETKISRNLLQEQTAIVDGYSSFFSFPKWQSGYSGVATYCSNTCTPYKAEESLITSSAELQEDFPEYDLVSLDSEGRVIITYHNIVLHEERKSLAVINVYCPRVDPDKPERHIYKMHFLTLLQKKAKELQDEGSLVIILGDLNISHKTIDHCDPGEEEEFNASEARQWLTTLLEGSRESLFVDAFRHLYPGQREAYTCWNTLTGARQTNYGTRIDYILVSKTLSDVISSCNILSSIYGSDHCPVTATLSLNSSPSVQLPSICTKLWPEFAGKQQKLSSFIQKSANPLPLKRHSPIKSNPSKKMKSKSKAQQSITSFFTTNQKSAVKDEFEYSCGEISLQSDSNDSSSPKCHELTKQCQEWKTELSGPPNDFDDSSSPKCHDLKKQCQEWKTVLSGPPKPPMCKGHNRTCVLRTVRKEGPNFGRQFFACAQPNGPATNPESSCNFFQWVKKMSK